MERMPTDCEYVCRDSYTTQSQSLIKTFFDTITAKHQAESLLSASPTNGLTNFK